VRASSLLGTFECQLWWFASHGSFCLVWSRWHDGLAPDGSSLRRFGLSFMVRTFHVGLASRWTIHSCCTLSSDALVALMSLLCSLQTPNNNLFVGE
jgi:hypothetical protein